MKLLFLIITCWWLQPLRVISLGLSFEHRGNLRGASRSTDVYAAAKLLDELKIHADQCRLLKETNRNAEENRLKQALASSSTAEAGAVLNMTLNESEKIWAANERACAELLAQYYTVKTILGAQGAPPPKCKAEDGVTLLLHCGQDASCEDSATGAHCKCNRCFDGDGHVCTPGMCGPEEYVASRPLLGSPLAPDNRAVSEVTVAVFHDDYIVVAMQLTESGKGHLRIGRAGEHGVDWGTLQGFSGENAAFGPVVTAHNTGRIVIAYRDKDTGGDGYIVGGQIREGQLSAELQEPHLFAKHQAQRMVLMPIAASRAVCLYAGHIPKTDQNTAEQNFGGALLVHLADDGIVSILGKYRFEHDFKVSRLAATLTSPTSFVVAYRAVHADPTIEDSTSHEHSAAWIGVEGEGEELAMTTQALNVDTCSEVFGIAVSLVSQNLVAYAYQCGSEKSTKIAILRVDPESHHLEKTDVRVIGNGDAKFVQAISLDAGMYVSHSFTYFQHPGHRSSAEVCRISPQGKFSRCGKAAWADQELQAASGGRLGDGRLFVSYSDAASALPFYQIFGPQEFLQE